MLEMETTSATTTSNGVIMVKEIIGVGPMSHLQIEKLLIRVVEVISREFRIYYER